MQVTNLIGHFEKQQTYLKSFRSGGSNFLLVKYLPLTTSIAVISDVSCVYVLASTMVEFRKVSGN